MRKEKKNWNILLTISIDDVEPDTNSFLERPHPSCPNIKDIGQTPQSQ